MEGDKVLDVEKTELDVLRVPSLPGLLSNVDFLVVVGSEVDWGMSKILFLEKFVNDLALLEGFQHRHHLGLGCR